MLQFDVSDWKIDIGENRFMSDIRKEQEREELHRAIWTIADELQGGADDWDFKSYVLGTMFYWYISENLAEYINTSLQPERHYCGGE